MRSRLLAVAIAVAIGAGVAGAAAAGAFQTTPATRTPKLLSDSQTTTASAPTTTTTTVATFDPWLAPDELAPSFPVRSVRMGQCTTPPVSMDLGNPSAWRCTAVTGWLSVSIPCFAPKGATNVTEVACMNMPTPGTPATVMRAQSGAALGAIWGTHTRFGAITLPYSCTGGYASTVDSSVEPWTVTFVTNCTGEHCLGPAETVAITKAWRLRNASPTTPRPRPTISMWKRA